jgi:hypothetical protein
MELEKNDFEDFIKKLKSEDLYPFISSELFSFFGYDRHNNFLRKFSDSKFSKDICISGTSLKINKRKRKVLKISKELFLNLTCEKHPQLTEKFEDEYLVWVSDNLKRKFERFGNSTQRRKGDYICIYESKGGLFNYRVKEIAGPYYMTSLSTDNYAFALGLDPLEIYRIYLLWKRENPMFSISCEISSYRRNSFLYHYPEIPRALFDSSEHKDRLRYLAFLDFCFEQVQLSNRQKKIHLEYVLIIRSLLKKQLSFDIKYRDAKPDLNFQGGILDLKKIYKKLALLCHPDKGGNEEVFKQVNSAYQKHDIATLNNIYNKLKKP